jgi:uncharacterized protein YciI
MGVTVSEPGPEGHRTFFVTVRPTRANWPRDLTEDEERALQGHADGLEALTERGLCVLAGPCLDFQLGVSVYDGLTLPEALAEVEADPMVVAGYFDADVRAMRLSFERSDRAREASEERSEQVTERVTPSRAAAPGEGTTAAG